MGQERRATILRQKYQCEKEKRNPKGRREERRVTTLLPLIARSLL
jgi:hypothetical protein